MQACPSITFLATFHCKALYCSCAQAEEELAKMPAKEGMSSPASVGLKAPDGGDRPHSHGWHPSLTGSQVPEDTEASS